MAGNDYFERQGRPIDLMTWADLWKDAAYRFVERTWIVQDVLEVVTVWDGFDPYRVDFTDAPPRIFKVAELGWRDGKLSNAREHAMRSPNRRRGRPTTKSGCTRPSGTWSP